MTKRSDATTPLQTDGYVSRAAPASSFATAAAVASTGAPCGIVTEAEITLASIDGMKRKPGRPDSTIPMVTIITPTPTDAVT